MEIKHSKATDAFMKRCCRNLKNDQLNAFLGTAVTAQNEKAVQPQLGRAGSFEFKQDAGLWPSLFIRTADWVKSPYHSRIRLDSINDSAFSYRTVQLTPGQLFNADAIQPDGDRCLADWIKLRALDQPCSAVFLYHKEQPWMLDAPSEALTNDPPAQQARGKVITFGLGIGYFAYMALRNPQVETVTVIEKEPAVIAMFEKHIQPQFENQDRLKIIHGDALDWFNEPALTPYDYIYTDIWHSGDDGMIMMEKLLKQYQPPLAKAAFWIEDSCLETVWTLVFMYFYELYYGRTMALNQQYKPLYRKVRAYFSHLDITVAEVSQLQDLIYNRAVLRQILGS